MVSAEIRETAPAILDLFVLSERVGDQRKERAVATEHLPDRQGRLAPDRAVAIGQQVQGFGLRRDNRGRGSVHDRGHLGHG